VLGTLDDIAIVQPHLVDNVGQIIDLNCATTGITTFTQDCIMDFIIDKKDGEILLTFIE
jgi:hypothetical protein